MDKVQLEWAKFLVGAIKESDLGPENRLRLEQERAVKDAQRTIGEVPMKPFPGGLVLDEGEDE